jgi:hypothetical protein
MAGTRILPHQEADPTSIDWGAWWLRLNGTRIAADQVVDGWDYATQIAFEVQPSIDEQGFLVSTGLQSVEDCEVVAIVECPNTGYRFQQRRSLADLSSGSEKVLVVEPPLGTIADKVILSIVIVLARSVPSPSDDVATRSGARLAAAPRRSVSLEGEGARFPTEAAPFSSMRFPGALWAVQCDFLHAEEALASSVRLFINTEHVRSDALLDATHPEHQLLQSALEVDLVRQMVRAAQEDLNQFRDPHKAWPEGSAGAALENLASLFFGKSMDQILTLQRTDSPTFERVLQDRMRLFGGPA